MFIDTSVTWDSEAEGEAVVHDAGVWPGQDGMDGPGGPEAHQPDQHQGDHHQHPLHGNRCIKGAPHQQLLKICILEE